MCDDLDLWCPLGYSIGSGHGEPTMSRFHSTPRELRQRGHTKVVAVEKVVRFRLYFKG